MGWAGLGLAGFAGACGGVWALTRWLIPRAHQLGLLDRPGGRKQHAQPTPTVGGVAMMSVILMVGVVTLTAIATAPWWVGDPTPGSLAGYALAARSRVSGLGWLLAGVFTLTLLGFIDDRTPLGPGVKLLVQVIVAGGVAALVPEARLTLFLPAWAGWLLTTGWMVALVNAVNFLDNLDGLCAGIAAVALTALAVVGMLRGQLLVPLLAMVALGAVLGFLLHNLPPAKAFMGDAGALPLGLLLACLSTLTTYHDQAAEGPGPWATLTPVLLLAVPLYDAGTTLWRRWREGRPLMTGDRSHLSHRLLAAGLSGRSVMLTHWALTAVCGCGAVLLQVVPPAWAWLPMAQVALVLALVRLLESGHASAR